MTFYDVDIYSSKIAGSASGLTTLVAAINSVEKHFDAGLVVNAGWCLECKELTYEPGKGSPVYHAFMAREIPILEIIRSGDFTWRKRRGMGRRTPEVFLADVVSMGQEIWFQLELSEI